MPAPRRRVAGCTHMTVTRLYGANATCSVCRRPGAFGWVYLCTQDHEDVLEHAVADLDVSLLDETTQALVSTMGPRSRSSALRADRLSFLNEISLQQLRSYSPEQVQTILRQRENAQAVAAEDKLRDLKEKNAVNPTATRPPWLPTPNRECNFTACPACRPTASPRAFLSIDAVANGEVPPTSAMGFGFHRMGERPVVDAEILKTIGLRDAVLTPSPAQRSLPVEPKVPEISPPAKTTEHRIQRRQVAKDKAPSPGTMTSKP